MAYTVTWFVERNHRQAGSCLDIYKTLRVTPAMQALFICLYSPCVRLRQSRPRKPKQAKPGTVSFLSVWEMCSISRIHAVGDLEFGRYEMPCELAEDISRDVKPSDLVGAIGN